MSSVGNVQQILFLTALQGLCDAAVQADAIHLSLQLQVLLQLLHLLLQPGHHRLLQVLRPSTDKRSAETVKHPTISLWYSNMELDANKRR